MPALESAGEKDFAVAIQDVLIEQMGSDRYRLWFGRGVRFRASRDRLDVLVDSSFSLDRIRRRHAADIRRAARQVAGSSVEVEFQLDPSLLSGRVVELNRGRSESAAKVDGAHDSQHAKEPAMNLRRARAADATPGSESSRGPAAAAAPARLFEQRLEKPQGARQHYRLTNFAVGDCNRLGFTAAQMVAAQPGVASPVFFWGPSGTGKTHLLEAVRHELRSRHRLRRVILMSAEDFTNDFMVALRGSGLPGFRRRYRDVDALMLDDIQFFKGKQATMREMLYTFDTLQKAGHQMLFAADRPPTELEGVGRDLVGRLAGGMVCGLAPLDEPTRETVLRLSLRRAGVDVADEVPALLAGALIGDARMLSGAVNRLRAVANLTQRPLRWEDVVQHAGDLLAAGHRAINLTEVGKAVCQAFNLPAGSLQNRDQQRCYSQPRMLAMYLARKHTRAPLSEIGQYFGNRSHSTVIAANRRVERWIETGNDVERGHRAEPVSVALRTIENLLRA